MTSICIGEMIEARFEERVNRFLCRVVMNDQSVAAHLHDPGRLRELLRTDVPVVLRPEHGPHRKTAYDLIGVYAGDTLVSIDSRVPNRLVKRALQEKAIPEIEGYSTVVPEYTYEDSRIDFCLDERIFVEVKGVTLVKNDHAFFPDAPTERGKKHLRTLMYALREGFQSYIVFVVQRPDAHRFSPNAVTDPEFAHLFAQAVRCGVCPLVYTSMFVGNCIHMKEKVSLIEF